jgi:hypothetical protein
MNEVKVINGMLRSGDLVLSIPGCDYGCLVGTVTDIKPLGSSDRETNNETDDIYIDFSGSDYSAKRQAEIEKHFSEIYDESRSFEELPLDMVIMPPDALINITGIEPDDLAGLLSSEEIAMVYSNHIISKCHSAGGELPSEKQPMWTICWKSKKHGDGWDQFPTRDDILNLANTLVLEGDVDENENFHFPAGSTSA